MQSYDFYQMLLKPDWAPPAWLFGPVWTVLYVGIVVSFGYVAYLFLKKKIPVSVVIFFFLNLLFNVIYTPLQFGLQNLWLAAIDVILVWGTLALALIRIYPRVRWVGWVNIPYFVWVSFAVALQLTITFLNLS